VGGSTHDDPFRHAVDLTGSGWQHYTEPTRSRRPKENRCPREPVSELLRSIGHGQVKRIHSDDSDIAHTSRVITPHRIQLMALRSSSDSNPPGPGIP
jgi:hypothetical protein